MKGPVTPLLAALLASGASATIISDGGFKCIFNANGVLASNAQRNMTTALNAAYNVSPFLLLRPPAPGPPRLDTHPDASLAPRRARRRRVEAVAGGPGA